MIASTLILGFAVLVSPGELHLQNLRFSRAQWLTMTALEQKFALVFIGDSILISNLFCYTARTNERNVCREQINNSVYGSNSLRVIDAQI